MVCAEISDMMLCKKNCVVGDCPRPWGWSHCLEGFPNLILVTRNAIRSSITTVSVLLKDLVFIWYIFNAFCCSFTDICRENPIANNRMGFFRLKMVILLFIQITGWYSRSKSFIFQIVFIDFGIYAMFQTTFLGYELRGNC